MFANIRDKATSLVEKATHSRTPSRPSTPDSRAASHTVDQQSQLHRAIEELTAGLEPPYAIQLGAPELRTGRFSEHHSFPIITSPTQTVETIYRRYSDFEFLRKSLKQLYPGIFIKALPPKKLLNIGNKDDLFVEQRRMGLEKWINQIAAQKWFRNEELIKTFLTFSGAFDEHQKLLGKQIGDTKITEVTYKYSQLFPSLNSIPLVVQNDYDMKNASDFIKNSQSALSAIERSADIQINHSSSNLIQFNNFCAGLNQLVEVEKTLTVNTSQTGHLSNKRINLTTQFYSLYKIYQQVHTTSDDQLSNQIKNQLSDMESMIEVLKQHSEQTLQYEKAHKAAQKWRRGSTTGNGGMLSSLNSSTVRTERDVASKSADFASEREEKELLDWETKLILWLDLPILIRSQCNEFKSMMNTYAKEMVEHYKRLTENYQDIVDLTKDM